MAKSKKINMIGLILGIGALVGLVLVIVGMCIDFAGRESFNLKLFELANKESYGGIGNAFDDLIGIGVFAVIAVIVALVGSLAASGICLTSSLGIMKKSRTAKIAAAILALLGALLVIIAGFVWANTATEKTMIAGQALFTFTPAAGMWLAFIGALVSGGCSLVSALFSKK